MAEARGKIPGPNGADNDDDDRISFCRVDIDAQSGNPLGAPDCGVDVVVGFEVETDRRRQTRRHGDDGALEEKTLQSRRWERRRRRERTDFRRSRRFGAG